MAGSGQKNDFKRGLPCIKAAWVVCDIRNRMVRRLRTRAPDLVVRRHFSRLHIFSSAEVNKFRGWCFALKLAGTWWYVSPPRARMFGSRIRLTFRLNRRRFTVWMRDFEALRVTDLQYYKDMYDE